MPVRSSKLVPARCSVLALWLQPLGAAVLPQTAGEAHRCCGAEFSSYGRLLCANQSVVPPPEPASGSDAGAAASRAAGGGGTRLLILHVLTEHIEGYAASSAAVNAAWAERFGHGLHLERSAAAPTEAWRAGKVRLLAERLARGGHEDYLLYMDADAAQADFSADRWGPLLRAHPRAELLVSQEPWVKASRAAADGSNEAGRPQDFNNGVLLLRRSAWSERFVGEWARRLREDVRANDQEVLQELYDSNHSGARERMAVLPPGTTNSEMRSPVAAAGQRVIHLGGIPNSVRATLLGALHAAVCAGRSEAFGGEEFQRVFLAAMLAAADAPRPSTGGRAAVNGWLQIRQRLSLALDALGRKSEAAMHARRVWEGRSELFGAKSPDAVAALEYFAHVSGEVTPLMEAALAAGDEQTAESFRIVELNNRAVRLLNQHRTEEGESLMREAVKASMALGWKGRDGGTMRIIENFIGMLRNLGGTTRVQEADALGQWLDQHARQAAALAESPAPAPAEPLLSHAVPRAEGSSELLAREDKQQTPPADQDTPVARLDTEVGKLEVSSADDGQGGGGGGSSIRALSGSHPTELQLRRALASGDAGAHTDLGVFLLTGGASLTSASHQRATEAAHHFRIAAHAGDAGGQLNLANLHLQGLGVQKDLVMASQWFRQAAEGGQPVAQYNLHVSLSSGQGHGREPDRALESLEWLWKAADGGLAEAQAELGLAFERGRHGLLQDTSAAAHWHRKAADQGHAGSQLRLGVMHTTGTGVRQDQEEANRWLRKAAERGDPSAQANVGLAYSEGRAVPRNDVRAAEWFHRAAEQGVPLAQFRLAALLDSEETAAGTGLVKNDTAAAAWYRRAAASGHAEAQYRLGRMLADGRGVPLDHSEAVHWLEAASTEGHASAAWRSSLLRRGTNAQTAKAADASSTGLDGVHSIRMPAVPEVYGPAPHCPFSNLDLVMYTGLRDSALLQHFLLSLRLFMPCYGRLRAIIPSEELPAVLPLLSAAVGSRLSVYPEEQPLWLSRLAWPWRITYTVMQLDRLAAQEALERGEAPPKYFAFVDADVVLAYPVTCRSLFEPGTGRPWAYYWPHIVWGNMAASARIFNASSGARRLGSFMTYFPQVFPARVLEVARARVQSAYGGVSFPEAWQRYAAEVGSFDFYSLLGHAAFFDAEGEPSNAFVPCAPAEQEAAAAGEAGPRRCANSAHPGVHVPYAWHHCVDHEGPVCGDSFAKFDRQPRPGEAAQPSPEYLHAVAEILNRGMCFAQAYYGNGDEGGACKQFAGAALGGRSHTAHWRVWAYRDGQGSLPLRTEVAVEEELVERDRARTSCLA